MSPTAIIFLVRLHTQNLKLLAVLMNYFFHDIDIRLHCFRKLSEISDKRGYRKIIFIGNLDGNALFKRIFSQNFPIKKAV